MRERSATITGTGRGKGEKTLHVELGFDGTVAVVVLVLASTALGDILEHLPGVRTGTRLAWAGLSLLAVVRLVQRYQIKGLMRLARTNLVLGALLLLTLVSALWSPDMPHSIQRSLGVISTTVIAIYIGSCLSRRALLAALLWYLFIVVAFAGVAVTMLVPELSTILTEDTYDRMRGLAASKNAFGAVAGCALVFAIVAGGFGRIAVLPGACLGAAAFLALVMADSATAVVASAAGLALTVAAIVARRLAVSVPAAVVVLLVALGLLVLFGMLFQEDILAFLGRNATFTGRTRVWAFAADTAMRHPWVGTGYGALWGDGAPLALLPAATGLEGEVIHAHNGLLQIASELGLAGTVLWLVYYVTTALQVYAWYQRTGSVFGLLIWSMVAYLIVSEIAEAHTMISREPLWMLFVIMASALAVEMRRVGKTGPRGRWRRRRRRSHERKHQEQDQPGSARGEAVNA